MAEPPNPFAAFWLVCLAFGTFPPVSIAVLRYPDGSFESRFPLHVDECGLPPRSESQSCLLKLRDHLLEDTDCNRVICDGIDTSSPIEAYANISDWAPYKNMCGNLRELFTRLFDLGLERVGRGDDGSSTASVAAEAVAAAARAAGMSAAVAESAAAAVVEAYAKEETEAVASARRFLEEHLAIFYGASSAWSVPSQEDDAPSYANTTRSVLARHAAEAFAIVEALKTAATRGTFPAAMLLEAAVAVARRLQLLIENVSVTLLLNHHVARVEHSGRTEYGKNLLHEWYGNVSDVRVLFHEIPGKRWDTLAFLLDRLGVNERRVAVAEVGVEAANTSQRLLERNPRLSYIGVDPYVNNDVVYADVLRRLASFTDVGRFKLHRSRSLDAAAEVADGSLDLVFLDARHDYEAVAADIEAWRPKVGLGGILSGHDFSWMFPTTAMAVYSASFTSPERTIHLAPDGVWWFNL
eukprot:TRINITY_DN42963_c0_g1_i1.p1 TRINITY_DN42963_c0_g1~~TRINITY_DN42963_c0_g1_i1.p1  ORF type:complete len:467 (-),score=80.86 TRINITY_DN42963_c0_g1_i1:81-1481(-)